MVTRLNEFNHSTRMAASSHYATVEMARCNPKLYANSFFCHTPRQGKSFAASCVPVNFDLQVFKSNINRYLQSF